MVAREMSAAEETFQVRISQFEGGKEYARNESLLLQVLGKNTVGSLKEQLKAQLPRHPDVDLQTLIFRGKILRSEQTMEEIFANTESRSLVLFLKPSGGSTGTQAIERESVSTLDSSHLPKSSREDRVEVKPSNNVLESATEPGWNDNVQLNNIEQSQAADVASHAQAFPLIGFLTESGDVLFINEHAFQYREMLGVPLSKCRLIGQPVQTVPTPTVREQESSLLQVVNELRSRVSFRIVLLVLKTLIVFLFIARKLDTLKRIAFGIFMLFLFLYQTGVIEVPSMRSLQELLNVNNVNNAHGIAGRITGIVKEVANLVLPFFMSIFPAAVNDDNFDQQAPFRA